MPNAAQPSLLRRLMGARAAPAPEVDAADMGTAIGLDFSLDEPSPEVNAATSLAESGRASVARAGWLRRISAG